MEAIHICNFMNISVHNSKIEMCEAGIGHIDIRLLKSKHYLMPSDIYTCFRHRNFEKVTHVLRTNISLVNVGLMSQSYSIK